MANNPHQASSVQPWSLELVPLIAVVLVVGHVLALVYWIFRLATEKQPQRRIKEH